MRCRTLPRLASLSGPRRRFLFLFRLFFGSRWDAIGHLCEDSASGVQRCPVLISLHGALSLELAASLFSVGILPERHQLELLMGSARHSCLLGSARCSEAEPCTCGSTAGSPPPEHLIRASPGCAVRSLCGAGVHPRAAWAFFGGLRPRTGCLLLPLQANAGSGVVSALALQRVGTAVNLPPPFCLQEPASRCSSRPERRLDSLRGFESVWMRLFRPAIAQTRFLLSCWVCIAHLG